MKRLFVQATRWFYYTEHCRVGNVIHVGHYFFGGRLQIIGRRAVKFEIL